MLPPDRRRTRIFGRQFDGCVIFANGFLGDLLGLNFVIPRGRLSEGAKERGEVMSVKRFLGVELDGFVECAEGFLNASGLSGLQGNGAEMNGEVIEGGGILGIGFESLFPLINSPLTVVDVREETAVGNARSSVLRVALQEI